MISFNNIFKSYGEQYLLNDASFTINKGEFVGIVGPNGAGKSTLFKILCNEISPDKGSISLPKDMQISVLKQHLDKNAEDKKLLDFTADAIPELNALLKQIKKLEHEQTIDFSEKRLTTLGALQDKYELLGGYSIRTDAEIALSGLGFSPNDFNRTLNSFSGGWQMRAALASVLISNPKILLLDEPSNYLDVPAVEWLYKYLKNFQGTLLLISHDRYLLKKLTNITIEMNGGIVTRYPGDYDYYVRERDNRAYHLELAKKNQDKKKEKMQGFIDKFRAKSTKASLVKSQIKKLNKLEDIIAPDALSYSGTIKIPHPPKSGVEAIALENISLSYDNKNYILDNINLNIETGAKVGIVGYNGTGKTTLLRIIANSLPATSGKRKLGHNVILGYQAQDFSEIFNNEQTTYDVVKSAAPNQEAVKNVRNILGAFGFTGDDSSKSCKVLSGGEKIRLSFARIFINPPNFLVLDEPTTHLDIAAREALQFALKEYKGTVCIVSHDIEFISDVADTIIAMTQPASIMKYLGGYEYYLDKVAQIAKNDTSNENDIDSDANSNNKKLSRKDKADFRKTMQKTKNKLSKKVTEFENKIEILEEENEQLVEQLSDENAQFAKINRRIKEVQDELNDITNKWEESAEELEEFMIEYNENAR